MDLPTAAGTLTRHILDTLPDWEACAAGSPVLAQLYADANTALDFDRRILTDTTLDNLYARVSAVNSAESPNPRTPASDRAEQLIQHLVHQYTADLNLALMRAGYPGERIAADALTDITDPATV